MAKLLICIICMGVMGACVLQLRQQRLELSHQCNRLHDQITEVQIKLWNQQLSIATCTAPNAIEKTLEQYDLELVPSNPTLTGETGDDPL